MKGRNQSQAAVVVAAILLVIPSIPASAQTFNRREVSQTPYDSYMGSFRTVAARGPGSGLLTMDQVQALTERANDFRYNHVEAYKPQSPEELEATGRGDCKDKAVWLYARLAEAGAREVQLVIGKSDSRAQEFHAWLYLKLGGRTYLLDPTFSGSVNEASEFGMEEYIPVYAYDSNGSYIYEGANTGLTFDPRYQMPIPSVAGGQ
jgi:transglutaminase-like putative cysteine protease